MTDEESLTCRPQFDYERVLTQIYCGDVDASQDAARRIAQKIEDQGGFWGKRKTFLEHQP